MVQLMKRSIVVLMLVLFVLSIVPSIVAETLPEGTVNRETLEIKETSQIPRVETTEASKEMIVKEPTVIVDPEDQMMEKKVVYEQLKERYMDEKEEYLSDKANLEQLKSRVRECQDDNSCESQKTDLKRGVKQHLIKTIALIDQSLARLTHQVEKSRVLTEEEKTAALARINEVEQRLTAKVEEIKALNADTLTNEELQTQVQELKALWQEIRKIQRRTITELISGRHQNLMEIYAVSVQRAETQIAKLESLGADETEISKLQELLSAFELKVEEVKSAHKAARDVVLKAKTLQTAESIDAAHLAQENVRTKMTEAKAALRELLSAMKEVREGLTPKAVPNQPQAVAVQ